MGASEAPVVRTIWILATAAWAGATVYGFAEMVRFEATPGDISPAPATWPADTAIARAADRPTLVMFVHPHCACTGASLGELAKLLNHAPGAHAVVVVADDGPSDNRTAAEALP